MPTTRQSFTADGLRHLDAVLAGFIDDGSEPGIVSSISRNDHRHVTVVGETGFGSGAPIQRDAIFRISSNTKPIAGVAAMILVDDGVLRLDSPIDTFIPELANREVLRDPTGPLDDTVPARRAITVEDLLTFRFGLGAIFDGSPISTAMAAAGIGMGIPSHLDHLPPNQWLANLSRLPLAHQPGEAWLYHTSAEVLGVLIARASGMTFGEFLQERVFGPLGMVDTSFRVPEHKLHRLLDPYQDDPDTGNPAVWDAASDSVHARPTVFEDGGGGLVSTLDDALRFASMMRNGGIHEGKRVLSDGSHRLMTTNQLTPEQIAGANDFLDGEGWGYCQQVCLAGKGREDRYGWYGGFGTMSLYDPRVDLTMILMTHLVFFGKTGPHLLEAWEHAVYAALA